MRIQLTRKEVKSLRKTIVTINKFYDLNGKSSPVFFDEFQVSKRAYLLSMISGTLNIDIAPSAVAEYCNIINDLSAEAVPIFKAMYNMGKTLGSIGDRYDERINNFKAKCNEDVSPEDRYSKQTRRSSEEAV